MNRVNSCIPGLDRLMGGGFPENDVILLSGGCGSGKTIFGLQYLYFSKEKGIYITFEDEPEEIRSIAESFGWDIESREDSLRIAKFDPFQLEDVMDLVQNNIREMGATRVVIDSISSLGTYVKDISELRRNVLTVKEMMKKNGCTTILISETAGPGISRFGVEEFIADDVILLQEFLSKGEYMKGISVRKMRGSAHSDKIYQYGITKKGFEVHPKPVPF